MKRKIITALAAGAAAVGGMMTGPSGQQIMEQMAQQTEQTQIEQKAPSQQQRVTQQAQNQQQRTTNQVIRNYLPAGGSGLFLSGNFGISPKDYGEYLLRTGKNKQNDRKRKHIAKGFA